MRVHRNDRVLRLAMTMADGAIQGLGSIGFEEHEAAVDGRDRFHVGVCGCVCVCANSAGWMARNI